MKISSSWLSEFISINNKTIEQELTQLGLEVDTISKNKNDYIKSESKKGATFKNCLLVKNPHFLSNLHETW